MRVLSALAIVLGLAFTARAAEPVKQTINVLDLIKSGAVEYHVNNKLEIHDEPKDVWSFLPDGTFRASGRGYGYVVTKDSYRDYHLVLEYKWTEKTFGKREDKARDNGILLHAYGPHGAYSDTWMASIECQIIEGGTGDILVLSPKLADGTELTTSLTAEFALDRDKEKIWKKGEPRQLVTKGRINWEHRDVDWADKKGFRGRKDVDSPSGEWNRLEVIAKGDTLQYFVNGILVNEAFDAKPSEGRLCLQTEGAEMIVRRYELHPLGEFKEKWSAIQASGGSNIDVLESRDAAWSPEKSLAAIELDGPYEAQLVACEPFVRDPVEVTWDAEGRFYVADMMDYPLGNPAGGKHLSRIQQLIDDNGDGRMDRAVTFADDMDFVQGLLPYKGGLVATTRTEVLWLKDTDGDGKADVREALIKGFNPKHAQLQVSAPRWGLDNCIYFCNGIDSKEIYPTEALRAEDGNTPAKSSGSQSPSSISHLPTSTVVTRTNFRWDPATNKIEPVSGFGQYGGAFDDWGHHFSCSNRSPVMFAVMPYEAVIRNPHAGIAEGWENIAPYGSDSRIYPLIRSHTTADAHAGTNTAACGLGVYRGDLMPELKNDVFTCDPTGQLVSRYKIEPNGASLKALKQGDHTEFFRSRDEWTRPVSMTYGPDGAIYICDMYRQYIDHARFFPEEFVKTHDMRKGENEGRIWRVVPKGKKANPIKAAPKDIAGQVAWLGHENAWQRETAQRLLLETDAFSNLAFWQAMDSAPLADLFTLHSMTLLDSKAANNSAQRQTKPTGTLSPLMESVYSKLVPFTMASTRLSAAFMRIGNESDGPLFPRLATAHDTLAVFDLLVQAGSYPRPGIEQYQQAALQDFPDDPWIHRAVLSANPRLYEGQMTGSLTQWFLSSPASKSYSKPKYDFVKQIANTTLGNLSEAIGNKQQFTKCLQPLLDTPGQLLWWKPALLQGLAEGLPKSGGKLDFKSLAELIAKPPAEFAEAAKEIAALLAQADVTIADASAPLDQRLAVIPLLAQRPQAQVEPILKSLLAADQPAELQAAAMGVVKKMSVKKLTPLLYALLPTLGPASKREVFASLISANPTEVFAKMERGEIPKGLADAETRWRFLKAGTPELRAIAERVFGKPSEDRAAVIKDYTSALAMKGDGKRGHVIFQSICIACHKVRGEGVEVGPDITDVRTKAPEALLSDILDPNRMCEARWSSYQIDTKDGKILVGLVAAESASGVTLKGPGLNEEIARNNIAKMTSLDRTLMPPGLEAAINKQQMADLLAFLRGE